MTSPSLKTSDDDDESTEVINDESDEEIYISNYHWQRLTKCKTTGVKRSPVSFFETPPISKNSKFGKQCLTDNGLFVAS